MENANLDDVLFIQENIAGVNCPLRLETTDDENYSRTRFLSRLEDEVNLPAKL